jgi:hypothetical protein
MFRIGEVKDRDPAWRIGLHDVTPVSARQSGKMSRFTFRAFWE